MSTPRTYRTAILGCGHRGANAARAYQHHARTQVVAVCDTEPGRLRELGDELQVAARYDDVEAMLTAEQPDIVVVATQTDLHFPLAMRVLATAAAHIDIEKPITIDLEQADQLLGAAVARGTRIAVHHQGSSVRSLRAAKAALDAGRIGRPLHVTARGSGYYGGYELLNIGTHMLNAVLELLGPVAAVSATLLTDGRPTTVEDIYPAPNGMGTLAGECISANLTFAAGISGTLLQHMVPAGAPTRRSIEVTGTTGSLRWWYGGAWVLDHTEAGQRPGGDWQPLPVPEDLQATPAPPLAERGMPNAEYWYVDDYVAALDGDHEHPSSGTDARHILEVIMAVFESGLSGQSVALPQVHRGHPLLGARAAAGLAVPVPRPRPYPDWLKSVAEQYGWPAARTGL